MGNLFFADPEVYARDTHTPHLWTGDRMNSYCKCCSLIMVQCSSRRPTRVHFLRSYFACHILLLIFLADHHPHTAVVHTVFKLSTHDLSSNKILQIVDTLIRPPEQSTHVLHLAIVLVHFMVHTVRTVSNVHAQVYQSSGCF